MLGNLSIVPGNVIEAMSLVITWFHCTRGLGALGAANSPAACISREGQGVSSGARTHVGLGIGTQV